MGKKKKSNENYRKFAEHQRITKSSDILICLPLQAKSDKFLSFHSFHPFASITVTVSFAFDVKINMRYAKYPERAKRTL